MKNVIRNAVFNMTSKTKVGDTVELMGREITRQMPGLWIVNGIECVGINDLLDAFGVR